MNEKVPYPIRINKYLAQRGYATRKGADELISAGNVTVNGKRAVLGQIIREGDIVKVSEKRPQTAYLYFAYNKLRGIITHSPRKNERDIRQTLGRTDLFPIGRLDKDSHGLMILTNDGRITDRMLRPRFEHEKEYIVTTQEPVTPSMLAALERGVVIDGSSIEHASDARTKPCKTRRIGARTFAITLVEGQKHQIRRMCAAVRLTIIDLKRTRIMNIRLGTLKPNAIRPIEDAERSRFLKALGL